MDGVLWSAAANAVVGFHFAFIVFALLGAALLVRWPWLVWLHLPALAWGGFVEFSGRLCPLTAIENSARDRAGQAGYSGAFMDHYLTPVIYPAGLTRETQFVFGSVLIVVNVLFYLRFWRSR